MGKRRTHWDDGTPVERREDGSLIPQRYMSPGGPQKRGVEKEEKRKENGKGPGGRTGGASMKERKGLSRENQRLAAQAPRDKVTGELLLDKWEMLPAKMMAQANVAGVGTGALSRTVTKDGVPDHAARSYWGRRRRVMGPVSEGGTGALTQVELGQERPSLDLAMRKARETGASAGVRTKHG